ncbi:serine-threonine protein kinase, putative [Entamoeba invadens IP1]|uniref:Serine-threonine protein kinase, putative n=1 Tax=Entamoeba invadens IP1 TaxID=370355 RepID=A0A0A1U9E3_ENTIV|nr:serine-threonine protein kinase, putative [Entamoeba invadens IP1]ELP91637.1 serine-threonine protein kinase, putative [Entamoeba invadens IP1]|eukprot:XP_004258408.1 serine-threonine protein kinase, putative [Entamoeba invadens IP1]
MTNKGTYLFFLLYATFFITAYAGKDHIDVCGVGCPTCRPDGSCMSVCFGGFNQDDDCSTCSAGYINYPYCTALCGNFVIDAGEQCDGGEGCNDGCQCDTENGYSYQDGKCSKDTSTSELTMNIITGILFLICVLAVLCYAAYLTYAKKYRLLNEDATSNTSLTSGTTDSSSSEKKRSKTSKNTKSTNTPPSLDMITKSTQSSTSSISDSDTNTSSDTSSDNTDRSTKRRRRAIFRQRGDIYTKIPERAFFSSTPSFPLELSKTTLLFGGSFEKLKVRTPYTDTFNIVNMRNSPWNFSVKEIKTPKFEILVDPVDGTIAPGTQVNIIAQIKLKCSCRVNAQLVVNIQHQEKTYTSNIDIRADAQDSEYIDGDEFDLDNLTASDITVGQCYSLVWKQKPIFVKTFSKAQNPDIAMRTEIKFLQILNEQQLAAKYYGKVLSHKISCIVVEYYPLGTLDHFLDQQVISPKLKKKMAVELVAAISLLHSFHFVYRQLTPLSVLVSSVKLKEGPHVKLCGCSQVVKADAVQQIKKDAKEKFNYFMDPLVFNANTNADYPTDMFSLAHILLLLYFGEQTTEVFKVSPYELYQMQTTQNRLFTRTELTDKLPQKFAELVATMWDTDRAERPSANEMTKRIKEISFVTTTDTNN